MTVPGADLQAPVEKLSPRQREVLQLIAKGLTNKEVGSALGMSSETVRTHLSAIFTRLQVTNRTEAAAVYVTWQADAGQPIDELAHRKQASARASITRVAEILERPAIAVLPMLALDNDPCTAATTVGLSRDLVALFSRWCWFPVIAHSSTQSARGLGLTCKDIGKRLGARFLVDGALRSSPSSWRLNLCVTDTDSGYTVWAQTYDFAREQVFCVQDAVCQAVVAAVYPRLIATVAQGLLPPSHPDHVDAWELAHRAFVQHERRERESNHRAQAGFAAAIHREPNLVLGHFGLGLCAFDSILNQWGPLGAERDRLSACADRCRELAPHMAEGYYLAARHFQSRGEPDRAASLLEEAIGHNPSFTLAHVLLAQVLLFAGRLDEGVLRMQQACRLGPGSFVTGMAVAHFVRRDFEKALAAAERAIESNPRYPFALALASASAFWLQDFERAGAHAAALGRIQPGFDASGLLRTFGANLDAVSCMATALASVRTGR